MKQKNDFDRVFRMANDTEAFSLDCAEIKYRFVFEEKPDKTVAMFQESTGEYMLGDVYIAIDILQRGIEKRVESLANGVSTQPPEEVKKMIDSLFIVSGELSDLQRDVRAAIFNDYFKWKKSKKPNENNH